MKINILTAIVMGVTLFSLTGCYWPGPWHDRHHHDRGDGGRYERHDNRDGYGHDRGDHYYRR
ncbi:MAG: hypothetical protein PHI97_27390 [Desulfobulbus sp.]|nr:hypothetical protein [Desulfobulbus sp.]